MRIPETAVLDALLVDDDDEYRSLVEAEFSRADFRTHTASTGQQALALARKLRPAVIILDFGLPDITGIEIVKILKNDPQTSGILIVVLTGNNANGRQVTCLDDGADIYAVKGSCPMEAVVAQARALLRVRHPALTKRLRVGPVAIDLDDEATFVDGKPTKPLTPKEFELLALLMSESPKTVGWEAVAVRFSDSLPTPPQKGQDSVRVHLCHVKKKLGQRGGACLVTHKLRGLQFLPPSE